MKTALGSAVLAALVSSTALAQDVQIKINLPWLTPPPLVVVEPGIQVVPDYDDEVFFVDSWYWMRRDGKWCRSKDHRGGWAWVSTGVPVGLVKLPPGKYKKWKAKEIRQDMREVRHDAREIRQDMREVRQDMKEMRKEERKEERREDKHGGGRGHGKK